MIQHVTHCLYCNQPIKGRSDKKFCNDSCRNNYNHEKREPENKALNEILKAIKSNRKVIKTLLNGNKTRVVQKDDRIRNGFDFRFYMHHFSAQGYTYTFCFDYGYKNNKEEEYTIVKGYSKAIEV